MANLPIKISTGRIVIPVVDPYGKESEISFNPTDAEFRGKFFDLLYKIQEKEQEYKEIEKTLAREFPVVDKPMEDCTEKEQRAMMDRAKRESELEKDTCDFCEREIDLIIGEGTCLKVFGGDRVISAYAELISVLVPYFEKATAQAKEKYLQSKGNRAQRRSLKNK